MKDDVRLKAEDAKDMLSEGHLFTLIWEKLQAEIITGWQTAKSVAERENFYFRWQALKDIQLEIVAAVEAAARSEIKETPPDKARPFKAFLDRWRKKKFERIL